MRRRTATSQSEHDRGLEAWAHIVVRRFSGDVQLGTNPGDLRRIQVGPDLEPRSPDVLVWRAETADGRDGTAELVAEIETSDALSKDEVAEWPAYGTLPAPFHLVVPAGPEEQAIRLLKKKAVRVSQLWSYEVVGGN
jgi:hypothetical protein